MLISRIGGDLKKLFGKFAYLVTLIIPGNGRKGYSFQAAQRSRCLNHVVTQVRIWMRQELLQCRTSQSVASRHESVGSGNDHFLFGETQASYKRFSSIVERMDCQGLGAGLAQICRPASHQFRQNRDAFL